MASVPNRYVSHCNLRKSWEWIMRIGADRCFLKPQNTQDTRPRHFKYIARQRFLSAMACNQRNFSKLTITATNQDSLSACDSSLGSKCERGTHTQSQYVPVKFTTEQVNAMIAAWDVCHLTTPRGTAYHGTSSKIRFEPSRQPRDSAVLATRPPPSRFQRKRINIDLLKEL